MRPAPDISWIVETRGVTLIRGRRGSCLSIPYPHAGLWAMLADGTYSQECARDLMALLMVTDANHADREVLETLAVWQAAGLLVTE